MNTDQIQIGNNTQWNDEEHVCCLKGLFTFFLFLVRSHILSSNGVWYSWFWPEGPINAPNSIFLGFNFVPRDLDSRRHMGPRLTAQGTLTRGAGDLDSQRHGTLTQIYGAASQGPLRCELRSPAPRVEVPCGAGSRGPWVQNKKNKKIEFEAFIGPYGQNQPYHTPLLFEILDRTENKNIVNSPFKNPNYPL